MVEKKQPDPERALADKLAHEAERLRPRFSDRLHERICRAVERVGFETDSRRDLRFPSRFVLRLAAAAALLVGVTLVIWKAPRWIGPGAGQGGGLSVDGEVARSLSELESLTRVSDRTAVKIGSLVDSVMTARQWAYLDQDARTAAEFLLDQLPLHMFTPESEPDK